MIAIIDYDTGNLRSVANALRRLGAGFEVTASHEVIRAASHVILPGVGEASSAMDNMRRRGLDTLVPSLTQPVLGICIGMQLMCRRSDEGDTACMGVFPTDVRRLPRTGALKIPHMGWDTVSVADRALFDGLPDGTYFYYVHSYAAAVCPATSAVTVYGAPFSAALSSGNFHGVQFHPEKSGAAGSRLLSNFLNLKA